MAESMSKAEERKAHRDKRKDERKKQMRIFYIALFLLIVIIAFVLSFTVLFHVNKTEVRGYSIYSDEEILSVSGIKTGDNLFLINRDKVREHITSKLPYIGDVTVKLSLPNKIIITVFETSALCAAPSGDSFILLNENGKVLGKAPGIEDIYTYGILEDGYELDRADADDVFASAEGKEEQTEAAAEAEENVQTEETTAAAETAETPEGETEKQGSGEIVYATPAGNVAQSPERKEEAPDPVYVLYDKEIMLLKGAKIKSAAVGKTVEFESEKTLGVYTEIMNLFIENSIKGITELNLKDIYNIVMKYENRIDVKVGSVTNLDSKMAFAAQVIKDQDAAQPDQMGIIDLTIDKKAYFQPVTTTKATTTTTLADGETTTAEGETLPEGETTTEAEEEKITNSSGQEVQVARTTQKSEENQP